MSQEHTTYCYISSVVLDNFVRRGVPVREDTYPESLAYEIGWQVPLIAVYISSLLQSGTHSKLSGQYLSEKYEAIYHLLWTVFKCKHIWNAQFYITILQSTFPHTINYSRIILRPFIKSTQT